MENKLRWALGLKPGDVFHTCFGFNRILKSSNVVLFHYKSGWCVDDIELVDDQNCMHISDGCCWPAHTVKEIEDYYLAMDDEFLVQHQSNGWDPNGHLKKIVEAVRNGIKICDDNGLVLPEYQ